MQIRMATCLISLNENLMSIITIKAINWPYFKKIDEVVGAVIVVGKRLKLNF